MLLSMVQQKHHRISRSLNLLPTLKAFEEAVFSGAKPQAQEWRRDSQGDKSSYEGTWPSAFAREYCRCSGESTSQCQEMQPEWSTLL